MAFSLSLIPAMVAEAAEPIKSVQVVQISDPVDLEDFQWVYQHEGQLFVTFAGQWDTYQSVAREFGVSGEDYPQYFKSPKSDDKRSRAYELLELSENDAFWVLIPTVSEPDTYRFSNVVYFPDGGGGVAGFVGRLEGDAPSAAPFDGRPIGYALEQDTVEHVEEVIEFPAQQHESVDQFVERKWPDAELVWAKPFFVDRPDAVGLLLSLRIGVRDILVGAYRDDNDDWLPIAFPDPVVPDPHGFVLENPLGDNDVAPHNSEVFVLGDIDGDGASEVFIQSQVSFLWTLRRNDEGAPSSFESVKRAYIGP